MFYANHLDAHIYSFYANLLSIRYEKLLHDYNLQNAVTAYRSIKKNNSNRGKSNIDFANEVFEFIINKSSIKNNVVVVTFDIKNFFDNLDHSLLKKAWINLLKKPLPKDHYQVFKNITKFSYIEEEKIFHFFQKNIIVERYSDSTKNEIILKTKKIDRLKYLKEKRAISYTIDSADIKLLKNNGLINANRYDNNGNIRNKGIPQGSPISAVLANIYMFEFDQFMNTLLMNNNGLYRRYSDDMILVCDLEQLNSIKSEFKLKLNQFCKLEINEAKTQVFHFIRNNIKLVCYQEFEKHCTLNRNLEYLGFQFDGEIVRVKNSRISSYYRKMKKSIKRAKFFARHTNSIKNRGVLFKARLFKTFTVIGSSRKQLRVRDNFNKSKFHLIKTYNYGNFLTYIKKTERQLKHNAINSQLKNHWKIFNNELRR